MKARKVCLGLFIPNLLGESPPSAKKFQQLVVDFIDFKPKIINFPQYFKTAFTWIWWVIINDIIIVLQMFTMVCREKYRFFQGFCGKKSQQTNISQSLGSGLLRGNDLFLSIDCQKEGDWVG